ncbi:hypothetical protein OE88DRAFT_1655973 [Heliocybe sulcata]|uniref:F-box domain-containing protein n=1 Tax=Heliocybe sulcata TaxID=5364 RepID=A0A5C3N8N7_9AGAM|nr:hypothetical protein OE88DRAFT_1655973 [Heliocybe sulcata]
MPLDTFATANVHLLSPPQLPSELWIYIFELATYVPGLLETGCHDPFSGTGPLLIDEGRHEMNRPLCTKRSLVLVCKLWCKLAWPLLHRVLIVECVVGHILPQFDLGNEVKLDGALLPRGANVRRLHCILHTTVPADDPAIEDLSTFIRSLPRLEIFSLRGPQENRRGSTAYMVHNPVPEPVLLALAERGPTLRVLDWMPDRLSVADPAQWRAMLSRLPGLRIIRKCMDESVAWSRTPSISDASSISLPQLVSSTWDQAGWSTHLLPRDNLESLRELELPELGTIPPPPNISSNITRLTLHINSSLRQDRDARRQLEVTLAMFPQVVDLVLWVRYWADLCAAISLPRIKRLGLGRLRPPDGEYETDHFVLPTVLYQYIRAPQLKVVRFVGRDEWSPNAHHDQEDFLLLQMMTAQRYIIDPMKSFTVEDREGRLLVDHEGRVLLGTLRDGRRFLQSSHGETLDLTSIYEEEKSKYAH